MKKTKKAINAKSVFRFIFQTSLASIALAGSFAFPLFSQEPLRVLTFNAAGIPWIHPAHDKNGRFRRIAERLRESSYDVVALQEVWLMSDVNFLWKHSGFPYAAFRTASFLNRNGLVILSRHPVEKMKFYPFSANEPFFNVLDGDFWGRKGVLAARIRIPGRPIDLFTTHFIATTGNADHGRVRHVQIFDLSFAIKDFSDGRPYLVSGDLNFPPWFSAYKILTDALNVRDVCRNSPGDCADSDEDGRLDYIFLSSHFAKDAVVRVANDLRWNRTEPRFWYSDHQGVAADIRPGVSVAAIDSADSKEAQKRSRALALIRTSIFQNLVDLASWSVWCNRVPLYNLYYTFFMADRMVTFVMADRELAQMIYHNQRERWSRWKKKPFFARIHIPRRLRSAAPSPAPVKSTSDVKF